MKKLKLILPLGALACLGFSINAQADGHTCADITFNPAIYERWPEADDTCLEVVQRDDGNTYARFEAEVVTRTPSGPFVRYTRQDGTQTPSRKANPPEALKAMISGQEISIDDLQEKQKVNIYLPKAAWTPPAADAMAAAAPPPPADPEPVAAAPAPEPEPEPAPVMPSTAGSTAWLAIMGGLLLLLGGALRFGKQH